MATATLNIKRVYEEPSADDGYRVLVDRLWPRGESRERAHLELWLKDIAPSAELRKWWNHDPTRMDEFSAHYVAELDSNPTAVETLLQQIRSHSNVTLLYAARDTTINHAVVLERYLRARLGMP